MKPETAVVVVKALLNASGQLDEAVRVVKDTESEKTFVAFRAAIGRVMGSLYFEGLKPVFDEHPELQPKELQDSSPSVDGQ